MYNLNAIAYQYMQLLKTWFETHFDWLLSPLIYDGSTMMARECIST